MRRRCRQLGTSPLSVPARRFTAERRYISCWRHVHDTRANSHLSGSQCGAERTGWSLLPPTHTQYDEVCSKSLDAGTGTGTRTGIGTGIGTGTSRTERMRRQDRPENRQCRSSGSQTEPQTGQVGCQVVNCSCWGVEIRDVGHERVGRRLNTAVGVGTGEATGATAFHFSAIFIEVFLAFKHKHLDDEQFIMTRGARICIEQYRRGVRFCSR